MNANISQLEVLTRQQPRDFVVLGKKNVREAKSFAAARDDAIGYLSVRDSELVCRQFAPDESHMAINIPLCFSRERPERRRLYRQCSAELEPVVECFRAVAAFVMARRGLRR